MKQMSNEEGLVLVVSWLIINIMAGVGAVTLLGDMAWTYMCFISLYFYFIYKLTRSL